jgi:hypothetical protein
LPFDIYSIKATSNPTKLNITVTLSNFRQELQKTKQELNHKNLQLLDLKSRTSGQDAKIVQLEAEKDKLRSHNMKLSVKLEELRLKYDPGTIFINLRFMLFRRVFVQPVFYYITVDFLYLEVIGTVQKISR